MLENAKCLLDEVITRLRKLFPAHHPYLLEAQTRQARFLVAAHQEEEAEEVLRLVLRERYRVLGPQNPRSYTTLKQLKELLKNQGRDDEVTLIVDQIVNTLQDTIAAP